MIDKIKKLFRDSEPTISDHYYARVIIKERLDDLQRKVRRNLPVDTLEKFDHEIDFLEKKLEIINSRIQKDIREL